MEWPHSNQRENDPLRLRGPPTGPRDEQHGCVQVQKEKPRRRAHRSPAVVAHNSYEQCMGMFVWSTARGSRRASA
eukprot:2252332-Prymnesium_polylepis.1